jgi:2-methylcitrate dehydratase PrpD
MTVTSTPTPPGLTWHVAEFISQTRTRDIPADVIELGRKSILDGFGLAIAGSVAESGHIVVAYLRDLCAGAKSECTILGTELRVPARFAAFANGISIHADDYDDTQLAIAKDRVYGLLMHPTAPVLPAALAAAERAGASGSDFTGAYHVGIEVCCKIAEAASPRHYQDGFHTTGTCGVFGAVAAASHIAGLDPDAAAAAIGLAGSQSAGFRENFGTMTKPFHPGRSAESGIVAVDLVSRGFSATRNVLEAPRGFYRAAAGGYDNDAIFGKIGNPWTFANPGISIKPHPSGSLTHPAMAVMLELITNNDIQPNQVTKIRVGTNRHMPTTLLHHEPKTELQAKFSMQFSMAILSLRRRAGLAEYTDETVTSKPVQEQMAKVEFYVNEEADAAGFDKMTSIVEIVLNDGRVLCGKADFGKGSPANPMSWAEVVHKFEECAGHGGLSPAHAREVVAIVEDLEGLKDIRQLTKALVVPQGPRKY